MKDILQRFSSVEECGDNMESSPGIHIHVNDSSEMAKLIGALTNIDQGGPANAPDEDYTDMDTMLSRGDDLHAMKHPDDIRVKDSQAYDEEAVDEWENSPDGYQGDEEYADHNYMLDKLSGGLNGKKKMHKPAHAGDNPMAVQEAGIDPDEVRSLQNIKDIEELKAAALDMVNQTKMNDRKKASLARNIQNSRTSDNIHAALWNAILSKDGLGAIGSSWNKRHEGLDKSEVKAIKERLSTAYQKKLQEASKSAYRWSYYVDKEFEVNAKFKDLPKEIQMAAEDWAGEPYHPDEMVEDIEVIAEIGFDPGYPGIPSSGPPDTDPYDPGQGPEFEVLDVYIKWDGDNIDVTHVDSIVQDITNQIDQDPGRYFDAEIALSKEYDPTYY